MAGPSSVDGNSSITRVGWSGFSSDDDVDDDSDNNTQHLSVNVDCVRCYSDECFTVLSRGRSRFHIAVLEAV